MKKIFKFLGLVWICSPVYAVVTIDQAQYLQTPPRLELSALLGGSYIPNTIEGQTLQLLPYEVGPYADTFTNQSHAESFTLGASAKYRFKLNGPSAITKIFNSLGVGFDIYQISEFNQTGDVLQFNMPEFENYTYILTLKNTRLMADFDLDFHPIYQNFIPFVEGGIGVAGTTVYYTSDPIPPIDSPNLTLPNNTTWHFAYQVGAGVKYVFDTNVLLSLRYLYASLGEADSSTLGSTATLEAPLTVDMSAQSFMLGFTYLMQ